MYQYRECGLDDVWLVNGYRRARGPYGVTIDIAEMEALHQAIAADLTERAAPLSGKAFRFLRKNLEVSQAGLGRLIGADPQAIARWEKGRSAVPGSADRLVRALWIERARGRPSVRAIVERLLDAPESNAGKRRFRLLERAWKAAA